MFITVGVKERIIMWWAFKHAKSLKTRSKEEQKASKMSNSWWWWSKKQQWGWCDVMRAFHISCAFGTVCLNLHVISWDFCSDLVLRFEISSHILSSSAQPLDNGRLVQISFAHPSNYLTQFAWNWLHIYINISWWEGLESPSWETLARSVILLASNNHL